MLESNILGWTSSVNNVDSFLDLGSMFETDLLPLDGDVDRLERLNISSCSTSPVHSLSTESSEAGDWSVEFVNGLDENYRFVLNTDPVLTNVVTADGNIADPLETHSLEWTSFSDEASIIDFPWGESYSEDSSVLNSPKKRKTSKYSTSSSKSWSEVTNEEQRKAVETLTQIISRELEFREKLEVIRIINPKAVVSPTDTEFVVDLACLNDAKFQRIKEYVQNHTFHTSQRRNKISNEFQSSCSVKSDSSNSKTSRGKLKTSKSKEDRNQMKALKLRQRKEYRQLLKERKSGLFIREEVLSLNALSQEDDRDIDILE